MIKVLLGLLLLIISALSADAASVKEQRSEIRSMAKHALARLYRAKPKARRAIQSAAGYAVFSNFGMKIFLFGGGSGKGMVHNNRTKKVTFMKMIELQGGLGFGANKFYEIFVFSTDRALQSFVSSGWELSGQITAAARLKNAGGSLEGALSVLPGVWVYQLTETGLAAEITVNGTKYYKDGDLN
ncbi:MAG: YSC84-related protein [Candidatus Binatia bacterium]